MKERKNMSALGRGILSLLAALLCSLMLSSCVKYFPREEQTSETESTLQGSEEVPTQDGSEAVGEGGIPNLPQDDATKRY